MTPILKTFALRVLTLGLLLCVLAVGAFSQEPGSAAGYIEQGTQRWHRADYTGAISSYSKAIEIDEALVKTGHASDDDVKRLGNTYLLRATMRRILQNFDEALSDIARAINLMPHSAEAYYQQAYALRGSHQVAAAIASYTKAIEINPLYAKAFKGRGHTRDDAGDVRGALADYDRSIEIDPKDPQTYFFRGITKGNQRDFAGAIADYDKMIELVPGDWITYKLRGAALFALGRKQEAERDLQKSLELNPNPPDRPAIEEILRRIKRPE